MTGAGAGGDAVGRRRFVVLGNPGSRRVEQFDAALARQGRPRCVLISWLDWIECRRGLGDVLRAGDVLRVESPGKDFEVERAILLAGARDALAEGCAALAPAAVRELAFDRGRLLCPRQWFLGFARLLTRLKGELSGHADLVLMNDADDIAMMFDKPACHAAMTAAGVPVPRALGPVGGYDDLVAAMKATKMGAVFVKLAHGSSGAGVVAYRTDGRRHAAWTTVESVSDGGGLRLYNTRKIRRLTDAGEVRRLIDALAPHRVHVERWLPKAGMDGLAFDVRVVMIAGRPAHAVARLGRSPITNLHLLNERRGGEVVRARVGEIAWGRAMESCGAAMRLFPGSLYAGVDLLFSPDFERHAVLEINAFGDQLPGTLHEGMETYDAEIRAVDGVAVPAAWSPEVTMPPMGAGAGGLR